MKNLFQVLMLLSMTTLMSSCLKDSCERTTRYTYYTPVYLMAEDVRSGVAVTSPQALKQPGKIYYYDHYLFINDFKRGIHVFDNSDASNPVALAFVNVPGNMDMAVYDGKLYADSYMDMVIFDLAQPSAPTLIGREKDVFNDFQFVQDYGYLVEYKKDTAVEKGDCYNYGAYYKGNGGYYCGDYVCGFGAEVLNITYSTQNSNTSITSGVGGSMSRFTVSGSHLFTLEPSMLKSWSLTDAANPVKMKETYMSWNAETLFPYGDKLFVGTSSGMKIMSIADPNNPTSVSDFEHASACDPVYVSGNTAYITLRDGTTCQGFANQLDVVDITDLSHPSLIKSFGMHHPMGLSVRDEQLFLCEDDAGVKVFDASDKTQIGNRLLSTFGGLQAYDVIALPGSDIVLVVGRDGLHQFKATDGVLHELSVIPVTK